MRGFRLLAIVLLLVAGPALAQEEPPDAVDSDAVGESEPADSRLAAAGWCAVRTSSAPDEGAPGCDVGMAAALWTWRRTALVAVVGGETVGVGVAWVVHTGPTVAVAAGVIAPFDDGGVNGSSLAPALGVTLTFGRGRE
jgi:hypothetical protein